jgi:Ca2+-binding RTX toxin-like protein
MAHVSYQGGAIRSKPVGYQVGKGRQRKMMMRRAIVLLAIVMVALGLAAGVALAADITCTGGPCNGTNGDDMITGSEFDDQIFGKNGNDVMWGMQGSDRLNGAKGNDTLEAEFEDSLGAVDTVQGGRGSDKVFAADGNVDNITCGRGTDTAQFDAGLDVVSNDCEIRNP